MASAAESLRSTCGSERGAPEFNKQRSPVATPHVGQGTENNCFTVRWLILIWICSDKTAGKTVPFRTPCTPKMSETVDPGTSKVRFKKIHFETHQRECLELDRISRPVTVTFCPLVAPTKRRVLSAIYKRRKENEDDSSSLLASPLITIGVGREWNQL
jgi:hypothetical protein